VNYPVGNCLRWIVCVELSQFIWHPFLAVNRSSLIFNGCLLAVNCHGMTCLAVNSLRWVLMVNCRWTEFLMYFFRVTKIQIYQGFFPLNFWKFWKFLKVELQIIGRSKKIMENKKNWAIFTIKNYKFDKKASKIYLFWFRSTYYLRCVCTVHHVASTH
jgi:hypothetical protein